LFVSYRSYAALHDRYRSLELLQQFTRVVSGSLASDDVTTAILQEARELLRAERAGIVLKESDSFDAPGTMISLVDDEPLSRRDISLDPAKHVLWRRVVDGGAALLVKRNAREDEELRAQLDAAEIRDLMAAPLVFDGRMVGVLVIGNRFIENETFNADDLQ